MAVRTGDGLAPACPCSDDLAGTYFQFGREGRHRVGINGVGETVQRAACRARRGPRGLVVSATSPPLSHLIVGVCRPCGVQDVARAAHGAVWIVVLLVMAQC